MENSDMQDIVASRQIVNQVNHELIAAPIRQVDDVKKDIKQLAGWKRCSLNNVTSVLYDRITISKSDEQHQSRPQFDEGFRRNTIFS